MASPILTADARRPWTLTAGVLLVASLTAIALRLGEWIPNVTAVGALALYAGGRLRWWLAWLSSARVVRCRVKSHNERNPCFQLPASKVGDSGKTAGVKPEEGGDDVKSSWPLWLGLHT